MRSTTTKKQANIIRAGKAAVGRLLKAKTAKAQALQVSFFQRRSNPVQDEDTACP